MNLTRCEKGHFYDKEKTPTCPHCARGILNDDTMVGVVYEDDSLFEEESHTGFLGEPVSIPYQENTSPIGLFGDDSKCIKISGEQLITPETYKVDIYPYSAVIYKRAMIKVNEGENLIYISGERLSTDARLKMDKSAKSVRILGKVKVTCSDRDYEEERKELNDKIKELTNKKNLLNLQMTQLSNLLNYNSLEKVSIDNAVNYLTKLQPEQLESIMAELKKINKEIDELKEANDKLNESKKAEEANALCIIIESDIDGEIPVELSYDDSIVSWRPYYEVHMDNENEPLRFRLRANIIRSSICEEWKDVDVRLFSESASKLTELPTLNPRHLYYKEPKKNKGDVVEESTTMPLPVMPPSPISIPLSDNEPTTLAPSFYDEELFDDVEPVNVFSTNMETGVTTRFELPGKWTFPEVSEDDQRFREMKIDIQEIIIPANYGYYAVPKISSNVFLTAKIDETYVEQLLDCSADIYVKDIMIGSCRLSSKSAANKYRLSLGKDEELFVSRKQTQNMHNSDKRNKVQKDVSSFNITIQNRKQQDVVVQIVDQIPVSTDNRIEVKREELSGGNYNEVSGEVQWNVKVSKKSSAELDLKYSVTYTK